MDRRKLLKTGGLLLLGAPCGYGLGDLATSEAKATTAKGKRSQTRWGMVVDLSKCQADCNVCMEACRKENNVAFHGDKRWDIHWIRKVSIRSKNSPTSGPQEVPLLCNQCDEPPCAQVCPVQATFKRADGIVMIDHHRCIGCRYCVVACPYNARFFNFKGNPDWPNKSFPTRSHGVAESCTFCAHLIDAGQKPACVQACPHEALTIGNLNDPKSEISKIIASVPTRRIRDDLGTEPKVYYIGLRTG